MKISYFIVIIFLSCSTSNHPQTKILKKSYIEDFKFCYFTELIRVGFNRSSNIDKILLQSGDASLGMLSIEDLHFIDSLILFENSIMITDSVKKIGTVAEGSEGKHIFSYALKRYNSKGLNKIAINRFKAFVKKQRIN